jgi:hypothetical protein
MEEPVQLGYLFTKNYITFKVETADGLILKEFSGALAAGKALLGDTVHLVDEGCKLVTRIEYPPLVGVIEFNTKVRHGFSTRGVVVGSGYYVDTSAPTVNYVCTAVATDATYMVLKTVAGNIGSTLPGWSANDYLQLNFTYEAA